MGIKCNNFRTWRWVVELLQALIILGLPFVRIHGESAFRFDIPSLRLHVFGHGIWMQELFIVLVATLFLALLFILITLVFGRIWCGWLCPQTVLVDFTSVVDRAKITGSLRNLLVFLLTFLLSVIVAASLIWYFVSPYEFIHDLMAGTLGTATWGFWIAFTVILFLNFTFLRHTWCKTVCPYSMLQGVLFDKNTQIIELDPARSSECINCSRCLKVCPTEIDIRKGFGSACINCAECIDACSTVMAKFNKKGLIRYAFGTANEGRVARQSFFIIGAFTVLLLVSLIYLMMARTGVEVALLPHTMEARQTKDKLIINAYVVSVINMLDAPIDLNVTVDAGGTSLVQSLMEPVHVGPGDKNKFPLFVKIQKTPGMKTIKLRVKLIDKRKKIHINKEANFVIPNEL